LSDVHSELLKINPSKPYFQFTSPTRNQDNVVGIVSGYRLDDGRVGDRVPVASKIFISRHPDWLWDPPSLLSKGSFPRGKTGRA
jgi:hypothetical protein